MATLFEAYVTNAGKYSEGQLVGETLKFPTTAQEVEALLKRIGVDGVRYQEIFITSFDGDVLGLYDHLSEYENLDELNHLACLLSELTSSELETLEAVLDSGDHCSSVRDIINLTQNLDCYGFYPGVSDEETLGRIYVDDLEMLDVPDQVKPYFDYEAYGRDACIHENGHFAPGGYIVKESDHFLEVYHGLQDIPKEHKVFSFPKGPAYERWAKVYNLKQMAAALQYLQEHHLTDYTALTARTEAAVDHFHKLSDELRTTEEALSKTSELMAATVDYAKTRPVFDGYKAARYSKKYLAQHEVELATYRAAKDTMNTILNGAKLPKIEALKKSRRELAGQKKELYAEYRDAQRQMREAVAIKANIDHLLGITDERENKAQER